MTLVIVILALFNLVTWGYVAVRLDHPGLIAQGVISDER